MSYLDPPRIHFGGAFFAGPSTINNYTQLYPASVPLKDPNGVYNAGWNPTGLAQVYFQGCRINSVVDTHWTSITDASKDSLVGVSVLTLSPDNPVLGEGVPSSFPKLVDLDPDQQGRSAVYGLIIAVSLPDGGGFIAWFDPPQLRDMGFVIPSAGGSWGAAGAWVTGARTPTKTVPLAPGQVQWLEGKGSPVYEAFRRECSHGIALKLTVDLHRNQPAFQLFQGDVFCYGRVQGTLGPLLQGEPSRWAPARKLRSVSNSPYNPAWFRVSRLSDGSGMLTCDLGGSVQLSTWEDPNAPRTREDPNTPSPLSDGTPASPDATLVFGFNSVKNPVKKHIPQTKDERVISAQHAKDQPQFVAFAQGTFSPGTGMIEASDEARSVKDCKLWQNSQVYSIPLTAAELDGITQAPVVVMLNGSGQEQSVALSEAVDGISGDIDTSVMRLEQGETGEKTVATVWTHQWGQPTTLPVSFTVSKVWWTQTLEGDWEGGFKPAGDDILLIQKQGSEPGTVLLEVSTQASPSITIPEVRSELDSLVYYIYPSLNLGDSGPTSNNPLLSVLLWRPFHASASPTWKDDVGPILSEYARMYPGMKGRFDIGDEATVRSNLAGMLHHMGQDPLVPSYMPVTRDLSPSKVKMILQWLKSQQTTSSTEGSNGK